MTANKTVHDTALADAVRAAVLAPSMHNTQPWRFRITSGHIDLYADPTRLLPVADPDQRAVRIACGAALFNLRLGVAMLGREPEVVLLPRIGADRAADGPLARVTLGRPRPATPAERDLYAQIPRRHSNRHPFRNTAVPLSARAALGAAARREGAWLDLISGPVAVDAMAELTRAADGILGGRPGYQAELAAWTRPDSSTVDGVPREAGGPAPQPHELLARRDFGGAPRRGVRDYETEPLLAILGTAGDTVADQLTAGQALQHVLLSATSAGLAASLMSQPIEVPQIREQLRIGLGRYGTPQMMLRFGYPTASTDTPRRPITDVIDIDREN